MPSVQPGAPTWSFNDNTPSALDRVDAAALDTQVQLPWAKINELITALGVSIRDDDTLVDTIVRLRNLHPEVIAAINGTGPSWQIKSNALVATTASITLSGEQTIDGVLTNASRVLVKNQAVASQNGVYQSGAGVWPRVTDADTAEELGYAFIAVTRGTANGSTSWVLTSAADDITLETTSLTWAQVGGSIGILPISKGGTGSSTEALARTNLGISPAMDAVITQSTLGLARTAMASGTQMGPVLNATTLSLSRNAFQVGYVMFDVRNAGAVGDGVTDDTAAFQAVWAAANASAAAGVTIRIPTGNYKLTASPGTVTRNRVHIIGDGAWSTVITFNPATPSGLFVFNSGASSTYQCSVRNIAGSSGNLIAKVFLDLVDSREFIGSDLVTYNWTSVGGSGTSYALHLRGREFTRLENLSFFADVPIWISKNPNATIDADFFTLRNGYLGNLTNGASILIDTGCNITNFTVDQCSSVLGKYFLYWLDTTTSVIGQSMKIKGVRREQSTDATGYCVYVAHNAGFYGIVMEDVVADTAQNGFYMSNLVRVSLRNCQSQTSTYSLITALYVDQLEIRNCFWQVGGTVSFTGMTQIRAGISGWQNFAIPSDCDYALTANAYNIGIYPSSEYGCFEFRTKQTVAAGYGNVYNIPCLRAGQYSTATITISFVNGANPPDGATVLVSQAGATLLAATANSGSGNLANKLTVFWQSAGLVSIFNQLSGSPTVTVIITVKYA